MSFGLAQLSAQGQQSARSWKIPMRRDHSLGMVPRCSSCTCEIMYTAALCLSSGGPCAKDNQLVTIEIVQQYVAHSRGAACFKVNLFCIVNKRDTKNKQRETNPN